MIGALSPRPARCRSTPGYRMPRLTLPCRSWPSCRRLWRSSSASTCWRASGSTSSGSLRTMSIVTMTLWRGHHPLAGLCRAGPENYKKLLSFHAISQVGYMVMGIDTNVALGVAGGVWHMLNHSMYKSTLFLTGGAVEKTGRHHRPPPVMGGLGKQDAADGALRLCCRGIHLRHSTVQRLAQQGICSTTGPFFFFFFFFFFLQNITRDRTPLDIRHRGHARLDPDPGLIPQADLHNLPGERRSRRWNKTKL